MNTVGPTRAIRKRVVDASSSALALNASEGRERKVVALIDRTVVYISRFLESLFSRGSNVRRFVTVLSGKDNVCMITHTDVIKGRCHEDVLDDMNKYLINLYLQAKIQKFK